MAVLVVVVAVAVAVVVVLITVVTVAAVVHVVAAATPALAVGQYAIIGSNNGLALNRWQTIPLKYTGKIKHHMAPLGNNKFPQ